MVSNKDLIRRAQEAQKNAYAPFSQFNVGAALLTKDQRVFVGCNIENSSFSATVCAERTAAFSAICSGSRDFLKIAIYTDSDEPIMPCGICRQVLFEFSPNLEIISSTSKGKVERTILAKLLPQGFRLTK